MFRPVNTTTAGREPEETQDLAGEAEPGIEDREEEPEGKVEEESDQSFPASDPPSY